MSDDEQRVTIHTDGACSGNPGPGGWGAILTFGDHEKELNGGEPHTTNNRMELMAAISALEALKRPCVVDLHTDSEYLRNGITSGFTAGRSNGWRTADKKPVKNVDLWQRLDAALGAARGALALGQGPRRPCDERARRSARARRLDRRARRRHRSDEAFTSHSGARAEHANPESSNEFRLCIWIPGPALSGRPGMTNKIKSAPAAPGRRKFRTCRARPRC